jgi:8-oxo-dGTP diphosphatase
MAIQEKRPKVGVGVIIYKDGKVLLGKRKNAHGEGSWSFPGEHLEFGEKIEECAKREVLEETGIKIQNIRIGTFTNDVFKKEDKHYITVYAIGDYKSGEAEIKEPEKCGCWKWFSPDKLPKPLFAPLKNLKKQKSLLI